MEVGLKINEEKTKYIKFSKEDTKKEDLNCPNITIEQVHQCKYLGSIINDSSIEEEIKDNPWYKGVLRKPKFLQK
jgi:hypothetical protein